MIPVLAALSLGSSVGGQVAGYEAGRKAAAQRKAAIERWQRQRAKLYDLLMRDKYAQGKERQEGLGNYLTALPETMGAAPTEAPKTADAVATTDETGAARPQWLQDYGKHIAGLDDAQFAAHQAESDRTALSRALDSLGFHSQLPSRVNRVQHQRTGFDINRRLMENDAEFQGWQPSNGVANLQLLSSILGTAGQAGMMAAGNMGGGPAPVMGPGY